MGGGIERRKKRTQLIEGIIARVRLLATFAFSSHASSRHVFGPNLKEPQTVSGMQSSPRHCGTAYRIAPRIEANSGCPIENLNRIEK